VSQENVAVVRAVLSAFEKGRERALLKHLAPDVAWNPTGFLTGEREYHGTEGVKRWLGQVKSIERSEKLVLTLADEFRDLGDRVLVLGEGRLVRPDGSEIDQELGWVWRLEEGKVIEMTNYLSHDEALRAAGVAE
jgi:ketosteroid isomerase-like protein